MKNLFYLITTLLLYGQAMAQPATRQLSLQEVIALAQEQSTASRQAETTRENSYWQWRSFKANYLPQLGLTGNLPDFSRTISPVTQPDGTIEFKPVANNYSELALSLRQRIGSTGGSIFVTTALQRFDDFDREQTRYNGNPAIIGIEQPLFAYNGLAWDKRIEPLRYQESQRAYLEDLEQLAVDAIRYFFDLLLAQTNKRIASNNLASNDTLYKIAEEKYNLGRLSRNDLLQMRLAVLNAELALAQANLDEQTAALALKTFVGMKESGALQLKAPEEVPSTLVLPEIALAEAKKNRKEAIDFRRRILEAESLVAKAKGDNGFNASLFATFGLTNRSDTWSHIYNRPENQQQARIGFSMPILDWGKQRAIYKAADLNRQLVQYTVDQEEAIFEQSVLTQVNQYNTLKGRLSATAEATAIALERYDITRNTFVIGRISITDLNIALAENNQAQRAYIASLSEFWIAHYNLRQLTLFDFEQQKPLEL